ncbi:MAG: hypothetical protein ACXVFN_07295 [Solirubrobacteraceae bacterium]
MPTRDGLRRREGIVVHRRQLRPDECTRCAGVPCTTLARTLFDLAAGDRRTFARAFGGAPRTRRAQDSSA